MDRPSLLYKRDDRRPPLLYWAGVAGVVTKAVQYDELFGLGRSLVDALAHPERVGAVGIAVHHQQRRMAAGDGRDIVPLIGKQARYPSWHAPGVNSALASGGKCAADNQARRCRMKFAVGVKQDGIAHGEAKGADAAGRSEARVKQSVGSDGVPVEIADVSWRTAVSVTRVVENHRRYTAIMKQALYIDPLRNRFSDSMENEQRGAVPASGGCFDKVGVQETAAAGDLEALVGEPDGGWCLRAVRASRNHGLLKTVKQQRIEREGEQHGYSDRYRGISVASLHQPFLHREFNRQGE